MGRQTQAATRAGNQKGHTHRRERQPTNVGQQHHASDKQHNTPTRATNSNPPTRELHMHQTRTPRTHHAIKLGGTDIVTGRTEFEGVQVAAIPHPCALSQPIPKRLPTSTYAWFSQFQRMPTAYRYQTPGPSGRSAAAWSVRHLCSAPDQVSDSSGSICQVPVHSFDNIFRSCFSCSLPSEQLGSVTLAVRIGTAYIRTPRCSCSGDDK